MLALPPPTQFRELDGPVAERIGNLWRLATTDDQRWEIEQLAVDLATPGPVGPFYDEAPYGMEDAVADVREAISDLQRMVTAMETKK